MEFCILANKSWWDRTALWDTFLHGLVKDALVSHELPTSIDDAIALAIPVDQLLLTAPETWVRLGEQLVAPALGRSTEVHAGALTGSHPEELHHQQQTNLCLYCGGASPVAMHETLFFHLMDQPDLAFIFGFPWLHRHNQHINCETGVGLQLPSHLSAASLQPQVAWKPSL